MAWCEDRTWGANGGHRHPEQSRRVGVPRLISSFRRATLGSSRVALSAILRALITGLAGCRCDRSREIQDPLSNLPSRRNKTTWQGRCHRPVKLTTDECIQAHTTVQICGETPVLSEYPLSVVLVDLHTSRTGRQVSWDMGTQVGQSFGRSEPTASNDSASTEWKV